MTSIRHYRFRSEWSVDVPPAVAYAILEEVAHYPEWWPQVKRTSKIDDRRFEFIARSFLPYDIRCIAQQSTRDPQRRILEVVLSGDLTGFSRFTIEPYREGSHLRYKQEVTLNKPLLNVLAPLAKVGFRANHAIMMRAGQAGLRRYAAGYRLALRHHAEGT